MDREIIVKVVQLRVPAAVAFGFNLAPIKVTLEFNESHPEAGRQETLWSMQGVTLVHSDIPRHIHSAFKLMHEQEELKLVYLADNALPSMAGRHALSFKVSRRDPTLIINYRLQLIINVREDSLAEANKAKTSSSNQNIGPDGGTTEQATKSVVLPKKPDGMSFISEETFNLAVEDWRTEIQKI